jgi:hypothetical protein
MKIINKILNIKNIKFLTIHKKKKESGQKRFLKLEIVFKDLDVI